MSGVQLPRVAMSSSSWRTLTYTACGENTWRADVYPDRNHLTESKFIGTFASLEACREAAKNALQEIGATDSGDYECGKNCKPMFPEIEDSVQVCEETLR